MPDTSNALPDAPRRRGNGYDGTTYYGRPQLKPAPFTNWMVGGYIFLAGLSGTAQILAALADLRGGRPAEGLVRRGRYLSLLAPTVGAALLVADLHTPKRFMNMLRIVRRTSPMSVGSWALVGFGASSGAVAAGQFLMDRLPRARRGGLRRAVRAAELPAVLTGATIATYTAALLSATSTPRWAAAPRALAVRFAGSSMATGAAALSLFERARGSRRTARGLDEVTLAALAVELAAAGMERQVHASAGIRDVVESTAPGRVEKFGAGLLGNALPLGLCAASLLAGGRPELSRLASLSVLAGSLALRWSVLSSGEESARRPEASLRFAQPDNLPADPPAR